LIVAALAGILFLITTTTVAAAATPRRPPAGWTWSECLSGQAPPKAGILSFYRGSRHYELLCGTKYGYGLRKIESKHRGTHFTKSNVNKCIQKTISHGKLKDANKPANKLYEASDRAFGDINVLYSYVVFKKKGHSIVTSYNNYIEPFHTVHNDWALCAGSW
jgi:hypothetical protein